MAVTAETWKQFDKDGIAVVKGFLTDEEVSALRSECDRILEAADLNSHVSVFGADGDRDRYFLDSADKISFFFEPKAVNSKGEVVVGDRKLAVNKIGHALHLLSPIFKKISFSSKIQEVVRSYGYKDAAIVQSMYIFKQPGIGGAVSDHQDATYLNVDPVENLIGLWFALEDATVENGCLWYIPGSHKTQKLTCRMKRNEDPTSQALLVTVGEKKYEGDYVAAPVKKGDLVLIHGLVVHKSEDNLSPKSRHAYTMHIVERHNTAWNKENWLQLPDGEQFASLYNPSN